MDVTPNSVQQAGQLFSEMGGKLRAMSETELITRQCVLGTREVLGTLTFLEMVELSLIACIRELHYPPKKR